MPDPILLIVGAVIGTVILLAIALCAGFWAGLQAAGRAYVAELTSLRLERDRWLEGISELNSKMEHSHEQSEIVGLLAQSASSSLSPELFHAIDSMIQTTRALALELRSLHEGQPGAEPSVPPEMNVKGVGIAPQQALPPAPRHSLQVKEQGALADPGLTKDEMWEVTGQHCLADSSLELESKRYPYACVQYLSPCEPFDSLPEPGDYVAVRCHDISVSGVSFLWPEIPRFARAVILIGPSDSPIYMVIEVSQYKSVFMHGSVCYLVGSRFVSRLERIEDQSQRPEAVLCS
jgi:hypothetical protein